MFFFVITKLSALYGRHCCPLLQQYEGITRQNGKSSFYQEKIIALKISKVDDMCKIYFAK